MSQHLQRLATIQRLDQDEEDLEKHGKDFLVMYDEELEAIRAARRFVAQLDSCQQTVQLPLEVAKGFFELKVSLEKVRSW